jgi:hypothetical protein
MSGIMMPLLRYWEMADFTAAIDVCNRGEVKTLKHILSLTGYSLHLVATADALLAATIPFTIACPAAIPPPPAAIDPPPSAAKPLVVAAAPAVPAAALAATAAPAIPIPATAPTATVATILAICSVLSIVSSDAPETLATDAATLPAPLPVSSIPLLIVEPRIYHRQMKIRFLKISQVIDNQVIVKNIETENSIADGIEPVFENPLSATSPA